jgi:hypothetical protein
MGGNMSKKIYGSRLFQLGEKGGLDSNVSMTWEALGAKTRQHA